MIWVDSSHEKMPFTIKQLEEGVASYLEKIEGHKEEVIEII